MYINCHSWFSFKYGVMKPETLLEEAQKAGVRALALTDIHCTAGIPDLLRDAKRFDVRPEPYLHTNEIPMIDVEELKAKAGIPSGATSAQGSDGDDPDGDATGRPSFRKRHPALTIVAITIMGAHAAESLAPNGPGS